MNDRQTNLRQALKVHMALNDLTITDVSKAVKLSRQSLSAWLTEKTMLNDANVEKIIRFLYYDREEQRWK